MNPCDACSAGTVDERTCAVCSVPRDRIRARRTAFLRRLALSVATIRNIAYVTGGEPT